MSDEKNETVTIPAAEYSAMKSDALRYYGQAESAGREAAALRAERDAGSISAAVRAVAERVGGQARRGTRRCRTARLRAAG